ncbi:TPA: hypothetical protein HA242_07060 [Candidatus Woesearchaeota archaeon]|nr:hypothetical protein [Candidatus Woesearchaeota archaeon]HIH13454.1 hypothetical protein [Candidatus Woesearchaeota archaeon]
MKRGVILILILLIVFSYGCGKPSPGIDGGISEMPEEPEQAAVQKQPAAEIEEQEMIVPEEEPVKEIAEPPAAPIEKVPAWTYGGQAIAGNYADSDFVGLGDGKYRMYYAIEPEVPGNKLEVYSATSSDGMKWVPEEGVRRTFTVFPDVVKLPDGTWRMYFQNAGVIKSAKSSDGLKWTDESGTRIDTKNNEGFAFERVAGPTTIYDGSKYIMAYSGALSGKYKDAPNNEMAVLMWATSVDGLKFEVQGMALDTRNDNYYGFADTPDLIRWDDGKIKMFFWGYLGVYESIFTGEGFTEPVMVYKAKDEDPMHRFPSSPPGDPTLGKVGEKWYLYYGQHTKGIYYATLE